MPTSLIGKIRDKAPVQFSDPIGSLRTLFQPPSGSQRYMQAMSSVGTLFGIVDLAANAISQVDWKLYRKSPDGDPANRVEVTRHPALITWNTPNNFMTRQELVEAVQQHYELTGEGWIVPSWDDRAPSLGPTELWPVRPDKMAPVPHPTQYLSGYVYTGPNDEKVPFGVNEVLFMRRPNPLDAYRGMGPVQSVLADLDATRYSAEWNRNFFINSAEPGGIIEVAKNLSDTEFETLQRRWNEQHKGVAKAHRVAVLEEGKWVNNAFSQRDMQFAQLRTVSRDTILEAFRMPKNMMGITENVNKANAQIGEVTFARWQQIPRLDRWKGMLNNDFLPLFGQSAQGLEMDYVNPVPEDTTERNEALTARSGAYKTLIDAGVHPDDAASVCALPPMRIVARSPNAAPGAPANG